MPPGPSTSGNDEDLKTHPLVSLLFWAMGHSMRKSQDTLKSMVREDEELKENDKLKADGRTLSWKDEKNAGSLTTTNTWIDDFQDVTVEGDTIPLKSSEDSKGPLSLRPKVLERMRFEDGSEGEGSGTPQKSPQSPAQSWGFFISITPPQAELFSKPKEDAK